MAGAIRTLVCAAVLGGAGCASEESGGGNGAADEVGHRCFGDLQVPEGGFQRNEVYLHVGSDACSNELCVVNHYRGDLVLSPLEGDEIEEQVEPCGVPEDG